MLLKRKADMRSGAMSLRPELAQAINHQTARAPFEPSGAPPRESHRDLSKSSSAARGAADSSQRLGCRWRAIGGVAGREGRGDDQRRRGLVAGLSRWKSVAHRRAYAPRLRHRGCGQGAGDDRCGGGLLRRTCDGGRAPPAYLRIRRRRHQHRGRIRCAGAARKEDRGHQADHFGDRPRRVRECPHRRLPAGPGS